MSRPRNHVPSYRLHKQSGQAIVTIGVNGVRKDHLLGKYGSDASKEEYARIVAQLRTPSGEQSLARFSMAPPDITVNEVLLAYTKWADGFNAPAEWKLDRGGTSPTYALRKVREMYGATLAVEFGPKRLKSVRESWIADGLARKVINGRVGAVKRVFRWAVSEELIGPEVFQRLQTVEGLRIGQTEAPDHAPVRPAVWADVEKALPFMPSMVRAFVLIQAHTGARAGDRPPAGRDGGRREERRPARSGRDRQGCLRERFAGHLRLLRRGVLRKGDGVRRRRSLGAGVRGRRRVRAAVVRTERS